jgi:hypothetical protein
MAPAPTLKGPLAAPAGLAESSEQQSANSAAGDQTIQLEQLREAANRSQKSKSNIML